MASKVGEVWEKLSGWSEQSTFMKLFLLIDTFIILPLVFFVLLDEFGLI
jgi:hypothetical protein